MAKIPYFHEREIWSCYLGTNIGREQNGTGKHLLRPFVIIKKYNNDLFLGIPLTTKDKDLVYYHPVGDVGGRLANAILIQLNSLSSERLKYRIGFMNESVFKKMKSAAKALSFGS